jgi:intracellular sulfur oxidation DsrE/DsrF family protein
MSGLTAAVAAFGLGSRRAEARAADTFVPARHTEDDWLDETSGKHRVFLDSVSPMGGGDAIRNANSMLDANKRTYSLQEADVAIILCLRHRAVSMGFRDVIWAKYGKHLAETLEFFEPKTKAPPTINMYNTPVYGGALPTRGLTIEGTQKRGVRFIVCQGGTRTLTSALATRVGGNADDIFKEFSDNLLPGCRFIPLGIVTATRAQERGYSYLYVG